MGYNVINGVIDTEEELRIHQPGPHQRLLHLQLLA